MDATTKIMLIALAIQTVFLVITIIGVAVKISGRIVALESTHESLFNASTDQRTDHNRLNSRVNGISRNVAELQGHIRAKLPN